MGLPQVRSRLDPLALPAGAAVDRGSGSGHLWVILSAWKLGVDGLVNRWKNHLVPETVDCAIRCRRELADVAPHETVTSPVSRLTSIVNGCPSVVVPVHADSGGAGGPAA